MQCFKQFGIASLALSLAACGGGGPGDAHAAPAATPPSAAAPIAAGIYDVDYKQFTGTYVFLENGEFYGLHFVGGDILAGHPRGKLGAGNSITSLEKISWANFIDDVKMLGMQEPDGKFGRTFAPLGLQVAISGSMGNFSANATPHKAIAPMPPAQLAGSWSGLVRTAGIGEPRLRVEGATIDAAGNFSAVEGNCEVKGRLTPNGSFGIYSVQASASGAGCKLQPGLQGILAPLSLENGKARIAVQLDSADQVHTAVFILEK